MTAPLPGDLIFTRSEGVVGSLIRFGERVRYHGWAGALRAAAATVAHMAIPEPPGDICWGNHIAVVVDTDEGLVEALAGGLTASHLSKYNAAQYRVLPLAAVRPDVTDADRAAAVAFATTELDRRDGYGWLGILSIVIQLLTPTKIDLTIDGTMICSAFGARAWEHAGVVLGVLNPMTAMPADLAAMAGQAAALR